MRKTNEAPSKEKVIKAINRVITVGFEDAPQGDEESLPGCCSMNLLYDFPNDKIIEGTAKQCLEEYIEDRDENDPKTNSGVMRELLIDSLRKFLQEPRGDSADLVILSEAQGTVQRLALDTGFQRIGSFPGKEGRVSIYLRQN